MLPLLVACLPVFVAEPNPPSPWLTDLNRAEAAARASGKPIFVVFRCEH